MRNGSVNGNPNLSDLLGRATALAGGAHFRSKQSIYYKTWLLYKSRLGQYHPTHDDPSRLVLTGLGLALMVLLDFGRIINLNQ